MMIVAMIGFAGQVFADAGAPAKTPSPAQNTKQEMTVLDASGDQGP